LRRIVNYGALAMCRQSVNATAIYGRSRTVFIPPHYRENRAMLQSIRSYKTTGQ